jgi:hypothetical protein
MLQEDTPHRPLRILHLEDSLFDHDLVKRALTKSGEEFDILRVETLETFQQASRNQRLPGKGRSGQTIAGDTAHD